MEEEEEGFHKETFTFDLNLRRGPRYRAYAEIREIKLRKRMIDQTQLEDHDDGINGSSNKLVSSPPLPPPQKRTKEKNPSPVVNLRRSSSMVGQSVPNLSSVLSKENRKPPVFEMRTPPPPSNSRSVSKLGVSGYGLGGSKSASGGEKRGVVLARKSYASIEDLKGLSFGVSPPLKRGGGGGGGGKVGSGGGVHHNRTVLGNSRLYQI